ncbi:Acyl transferase/acyl hydrolase/lysophospholipase [Penicillium concentricum]|uniref:Acyl transferase/acyl hydrolase/lysophospholipase n=1 Tax=Penicillium concentricum TaxID=293559 RepID=A0A9X0B2C8_9EURO|nr:Acyl transferase/acyl hydrolase/lysophospholipase [Penicillium concentricum]KAJ5385626.1 Acyl transferase/acyl hydrolase/lysophospholipase [Penicillium concentricum]
MISTVFEASVRTKARGSWNLHVVLPNDLDFFILLSSCGGVIGNRGQGNYNAGNTCQDALAHYRRSRGLSGTSLDLGHMLDIGVIAERPDDLFKTSLPSALGNQVVSQDEFHALLEYHSMYKTQIRWKVINQGTLDKARPEEKTLQIVVEGISEKLSNLLAISATEIDSEMVPSNYGVDSLGSIEIRNWLSKEVGVEVGVLDIVGSQSIVDLAERVLKAKG